MHLRSRPRELVKTAFRQSGRFRDWRKNRAEHNISRAFVRCGTNFLDRVARDAEEESRRHEGSPAMWCRRIRRKMRSACAGGQSDIHAAIHQNFCPSRIRQRQCVLHHLKQLAGREIFLADLDPVDSCIQIACDGFQETFTHERAAVCDVALNQGVTLVARPSVSPRNHTNNGAFGLGAGHGIEI